MRNLLMLFLLFAFSYGCNSSSSDKTAVSSMLSTPEGAVLYYNGDIVTMEGDSALYVESVVVKDGKILYAGSNVEALKQGGKDLDMIDLQGKFMSPGFIDAHGHAFLAGFQKMACNILPPPDGQATDIDNLIKTLQQWYVDQEKQGNAPKVIVGFGYDDSQLKERRHPVATDLDKISNTIPVILVHQSGHLQALNHVALKAAGYNANTPDPQGGVIRRESDGKTPNGVLEETAGALVMFKLFNKFDSIMNIQMCKAGLQAYKEFGFTTVQEGAASPSIIEAWRNLAASGELTVDIAAYPVLVASKEFMDNAGTSATYDGHFRIAGVKITQDGSPQGKTAYLSKPYKVPPAGQTKTYRGYPGFPRQSQLDSLVEYAFLKNWQVLMHCNGDAAGDMMITSVRHSIHKLGAKDRRPVMIHAQTARYDQLDSAKVLGIIPSFFSMHTFYWGDWHRDETLGEERAMKISPAQTAYKKGIIFTEHHDAPVGLPSSIMIMHTAVNRTSRSNSVIGEAEKLTPYQALLSLTRYSAYQYFEEGTKGTITAGKLADMVILDRNPMKIDPKEIINIKVEETIKEGKTVYKKS